MQPEMGSEAPLILERFLEKHQRVDHQHRQIPVEPGRHVQQHRRLRPEGGDQRHLSLEGREHRREHVLGPRVAKGEPQPLGAVHLSQRQFKFKPHRTAPRTDKAPP